MAKKLYPSNGSCKVNYYWESLEVEPQTVWRILDKNPKKKVRRKTHKLLRDGPMHEILVLKARFT